MADLHTAKTHDPDTVRIAFFSDLHYASRPNRLIPERRGECAPALLARLVRVLNREIRPDLTLCGGDLINFPRARDARRLTAALAEILSLLEMPCTVIRGNHDLPARAFTRYFPFRPITDVGFVRVVAFDDPERPGYNAVRTAADTARMREAAAGWDGLLLSFQHTPLLPPGKCIVNYENADELIRNMKSWGYRAAISGHYHEGVPPESGNGLRFFVQSAFCEAPFAFTVIHAARDGSIRFQRVCPDVHGIV